jgi:citronellyl-CoA dehydrogenase
MASILDPVLNTDEHKAIKRTALQIIEKEVNPYIDEWEANPPFPAHQVFKKFGEAGLLGINKPVEFGGMGLDITYAMAFGEAVGHIECGSIPMAIGVQTDMATPALAKFGSDELRHEFLAPAISGDYVACVGISEIHAGSDVAAIKTHARKDGDDYVINGSKMWITNSLQADFMVALVNTDPDGLKHQNKSLIVIPMDTPGITKSNKLDKLGMRSSDTAQIFFEDVRVPQRYLIGEENKGFTYQMIQFQDERLIVGPGAIASMERTIQETIDYASQREIFGHPLINKQVVQFRLAELKTEVEALRGLLVLCLDKYLAKQDVTMLISMLKLKIGRLEREVADSCLQYFGGMGYMTETPISRYYRDIRLHSIGGGADEVMLQIISKYMGTFS